MATIEVNSVTKNYGKLCALDNVSFRVEDGELLAILGPPGAGKSTTLKIVAGIELVTQGKLLIDGQDITDLEPPDRDVSMAFETYALYPHFTVEENLSFPLKSPKRKKSYSMDEIKEHVQQTAKLLQIDDLLERRPSELSGGQRQRVSLGRSLIRTPKVFLLDEPIAHLDAKLRHILRRDLREWQKEREVTTLYTTTDYLEAFTVGDRILVLNKGKREQIGTWNEIYSKPRTTEVAAMISDPAINLFKGNIQRNNGDITVSIGSEMIMLSDELKETLDKVEIEPQVLVGIFPSKIEVLSEDLSRKEGITVDAEVKLIEVRGSRQILSLALKDGTEMSAQIPLDYEIHEKDFVKCFLGSKDIHVFDKKDNLNIQYMRST